MQEKSATSKLSSLDPNQIHRRVMLGFAIFYTIVILSTSNLANAQIMYSDNSVDADSNIDSINNIGQSIGGDYENAKSLDGSYQQLQEGNSTEIAYIEDYIDQQSDVDSYPSSGSTTNFTSLQSTDSASAQLTEGNKRVSWGDPTQQELETTIDWVRCMAGDFNLGTNYQVSEIYLSSNTTNGGGQARLSVYQGGTLNDPAGATLIWDAGTVDAAEGFVGVTGGSAPLNNNQPIWVCVKSNDNTFNVYYNTSNDVESDFQSGTGRIMLGAAHSTDETVPFESTIDSTGATFAAFWYSFYIILEDTTSDRQLDQEYQFTSVIDYLPNETLSIKTGSFSGTEDINVTYWSGSNWAIITTDLNPNSWNNFSVLLISPKFTIKLGGSNTNSDTIIDTWNIDAILLVVSGTGDQEVAATALSNVDNSPDIGVIDNFNYLSSDTSTLANLSEGRLPAGITLQNAAGITGTSLQVDIGEVGNYRLVTVFVGDESSGISANGVSIDGKSAVKVIEADNSNGLGNHQELWILTESGLGTSNGTVTVSVQGADSGFATHVMVFYNVKDSLTPFDVQINNDSVSQNEILPGVVDIPQDGLLLFSAGNGATGNYLDNAWDTQPTSLDDGLLPEIEMTEAFDGNAPTSAVFAQAYWVSNTSEQTDRQFRASGSVQNNRGTGIIASFEPAAYQMDLEVRWNDVPSAMQSEVLAINTGNLDNENIRVDYWDGNNWNNLFSNLIANSWNNISITNILNISTFTIRFRDAVTRLDNTQSIWQIAEITIAYYSINTNYRLEWEHQSHEVDTQREQFELTIYGYSSNSSETFDVQLWNPNNLSWMEPVGLKIGTIPQWYNISITDSDVIESTITWRYIGNQDEPYDRIQTTLFIDYAGITSYDEVPIFTEVPDDIVIAEGSTGNILNWRSTDQNPNLYFVRRDGVPTNQFGFWNNSAMISISIDGLDKGVYEYKLTVRDQNLQTSEDFVTVTVIDTTKPIFEDVPDNITYSEGSFENTLTWDLFDKWEGTFELYRNGSLITENSWNNANKVTINIDGLTLGNYNFTFLAKDSSNNIASDTVIVTVVDTTGPSFDSDQVDVIYVEGSTGNILTWNAVDNHPDNYQLYQNGTYTGDTGLWNNGDNITANIDSLQKGVYNYTLVITDSSGNTAVSVVIVYIVDTTNPQILESSGDLIYGQGFVGNFIWWNASDNYPGSYILYLDGQIYIDGNWTNLEVLLVNVDRLPAGEYNFTMKIADLSNNYFYNTIIVTVIAESTPPTFILAPNDGSFVEGTTGNSLSWIASDEFPFIYRIYINGTNTLLNLWTNYIPINLDIDNLEFGVNNITIVVLDISRNSITHTIFITVVDDLKPNMVENATDSKYIVFSKANTVSLKAYDDHPSIYEVYLDETLFSYGIWENSKNITFNIDGLQIGSYNFTVKIIDSSFNYIISYIQVDVTFIRTEIYELAPETKVYEGYVDSVTGIWIDENNKLLSNGKAKGYLSNKSSGEIINKFTGSVIDGTILINIDYSDLTPGVYILLLEFTQPSYQNQTLSYEILVLAHQLEINVQFNDELVPNKNFTIEISVSYIDVETKNLGLSDLGSINGAASGISLSVALEMVYNNGTASTINYDLITNSNGIILLTLNEEQTKNLKQIQNIRVSVDTQGGIKGQTVELPADVIPDVILQDQNDNSLIEIPLVGAINRSLIMVILAIVTTATIGFVLFKYREQKEFELVKLNENLEAAGIELNGIKSIQQIILITHAGLPVYIKQIQSVGVDPILLSGMSTAISSFLQEVSAQESLGVQVMENQGLSITAHKSELSSLLVISSLSLPPVILGQMIQSHMAIDKKFGRNLKNKLPRQISPTEIDAIFAEYKLKISLTENLQLDLKKDTEFLKVKFDDKEMKELISMFVSTIDDENVNFTLNEVINFYRSLDLPFNKIANVIFTEYNLGILKIKTND